jgi:hypothetical protein
MIADQNAKELPLINTDRKRVAGKMAEQTADNTDSQGPKKGH